MQTPHILIVEDELVTRNTLKSIFEAEGYIVLEANNGDEMHQALTSHTINLVIMDINLPGKNGLLLARELREDDNIALMFLTIALKRLKRWCLHRVHCIRHGMASMV